MTKEELILKGKAKVRGNSDLMLIYINLFSDEFGYKPSCAGCTFNSDWHKFIKGNKVKSKTPESNLSKTFRLRNPEIVILSFKLHGVTHRKYSNRLTEEFVINFLTYGTKQEIAERKKLFETLPEKFRKK